MRAEGAKIALGFSPSRRQVRAGMPLRWTISPLEHIVVCIFEGLVTTDEILDYLAAIESAGAFHYRKILDMTRVECSLPDGEIMWLAAHARSLGSPGVPGPMAVVTGASRNDRAVTNIRTITPIGRKLRTFPNIHEARQWLASVPPGRPA